MFSKQTDNVGTRLSKLEAKLEARIASVESLVNKLTDLTLELDTALRVETEQSIQRYARVEANKWSMEHEAKEHAERKLGLLLGMQESRTDAQKRAELSAKIRAARKERGDPDVVPTSLRAQFGPKAAAAPVIFSALSGGLFGIGERAAALKFAAGGKIDTDKGIIFGVSLATVGDARGHGVKLDRKTLDQLRDCALRFEAGLKVKMNHGGGAGDIIGFIDGFRIEGQKLVGDLHVLKNYEKRDYVLELASTIPDTFGLSVAFSGPTETVNGASIARCTEIYSCDLVSEPAANPSGLFSKPSTS